MYGGYHVLLQLDTFIGVIWIRLLELGNPSGRPHPSSGLAFGFTYNSTGSTIVRYRWSYQGRRLINHV